MASAIEKVHVAGQSTWLDYISRSLIASGRLARMVEDGWITGLTSNPTIFHRAIADSADYQDSLRRLSSQTSLYEAYLAIAGEDIRAAADVLRPVYDRTQGEDGYVSFEAQAGITDEMISEARRMFRSVDRPNVMIKIPGVPDGIEAVSTLIEEGISVNITLLFDVEVYERFVEAYLSGLERRFASHQPLDRVASVASFFVSRVDTKIDSRLPEDSTLRGKVGIANSRRAYEQFLRVFSGPRWERLSASGARLQRPLWGSTSTKNPVYRDVMYVEELVAPHTVNTMPEETLLAFLDHGEFGSTIPERFDEANRVLQAAAAAGIDLHAVGRELTEEGVAAFDGDFQKLLEALGAALETLASAR
ncbi:MAG: transaldolase [Dehalococcoidia bacterium]